MFLILASLVLSPVYAGWLGCYDPALAPVLNPPDTVYVIQVATMLECETGCGSAYAQFIPATGDCGCYYGMLDLFEPALVDTVGIGSCAPGQGELGMISDPQVGFASVDLGLCLSQAWLYQGPYAGTTLPGPDTTSPADFEALPADREMARYDCLKICNYNLQQNKGTPQTAALFNANGFDGPGTSKCACVDKTTMSGTPGTCVTGNYFLFDVIPVPVPSATPQRRRAAARRAREYLARKHPFCPPRTRACVVDSGAGYECIDTETELESCGGCLDAELGDETAALGIDCVTLPGVHPLYVTCSAGQCVSSACYTGFHVVNGTCFED